MRVHYYRLIKLLSKNIKLLTKTTMGPVGKPNCLASKIPRNTDIIPINIDNVWNLEIPCEIFLAATAGIITNAPVKSVPKNLIPRATTIPTIKR